MTQHPSPTPQPQPYSPEQMFTDVNFLLGLYLSKFHPATEEDAQRINAIELRCRDINRPVRAETATPPPANIAELSKVVHDYQVQKADVWDVLNAARRVVFAPVSQSHNLRECPAMRALELLTPGGSEFIDDIDRCVHAVNDTRQSLMDALKKAKLARAEAVSATPPQTWISVTKDNPPLSEDVILSVREYDEEGQEVAEFGAPFVASRETEDLFLGWNGEFSADWILSECVEMRFMPLPVGAPPAGRAPQVKETK